jgi:hypothetical protein
MRYQWYLALNGALLGVSLMSFILPTASYACAVCGGAEDNGYFWGMVFLMSMPFAIGSFVGGWLLLSYRRASSDLTPSMLPPIIEGRTPRPASVPLASQRPDDEH